MADNARITDDPTSTASPARDAERARDAQWVHDAIAGDPAAFGRLYDAWFDRVHHLVTRILHDRESAQDVCQDAFLSAWRGLGGLEDPSAFGGWLLRIARNAALNRSAREGRSRPVDDQGWAVIEGTNASPASAPAGFDLESRLSRADDPQVAVADGDVVALVHEVATSLGERDAEVLDLQLRFDLTPAEVGEIVGLNRNAANQLCHRVRGRFATAFRARMLWNGGHPVCPELAEVLTTAGVRAFGAEAVALTDQHARSCEACDERRRTLVQPTALFAALPFVAPTPIRQEVAAQLVAHGVPMEGSSATGAPPSSPGAADPRPGPGAPPPPGLVDATVPVPATESTAGSLAACRRLAAAAALLLVVALAGGLLLLRHTPGGGEVLVAAPGSTTTESQPEGPAATAANDGPAGDPGSDGDDGPSTPTTTGGDTSTTAPPTTALREPVIELFELAPAGPQPTTYTVGPDSPTLRWSASSATDVQVRMWFDDGISGPQPLVLVSSDPSGAVEICPGTRDGASCTTQAGVYSFVIEATNQDGVTISSDTVTPPSFEVYIVIG